MCSMKKQQAKWRQVRSNTTKKEHTYADATKDYLQLKNTLKELIRQEREKAEDPATLRKELNDQYDTFVEKYGRLNGNKNLNVILEEDYERFLPQALENIRISIDPSTGKRNKVIEKKHKRASCPFVSANP